MYVKYTSDNSGCDVGRDVDVDGNSGDGWAQGSSRRKDLVKANAMLKARGEKQNTAVNCEHTFVCMNFCLCVCLSACEYTRVSICVCVCVYGNNVGEI